MNAQLTCTHVSMYEAREVHILLELNMLPELRTGKLLGLHVCDSTGRHSFLE